MNKLTTFKLEEYLGQYEFSTPRLLCCSDAETFSLQELLTLANEDEQQLWNNLQLSYTQVAGMPQLREQIAKAMHPGLCSENILCFAGAEEGIFCTLFSLCEPQDHIIILTPAYQSLVEIPKMKGCSITEVPLKEESNWRIDLNLIKESIRNNTKFLVMNFPHNPTGQIIREDELLALVKLLDQYGILLFSDEVYRLLGPQETIWCPPASIVYNRAISLGVMSKSFGMAGLRIGWIACQDAKILKKIEQVKHYTSICNSAPSEIIALIALRNKEYLLARNNSIVEHNLKLLDQFFTNYADRFSWVRPEGGCTGLVRYLKEEPIEEFCKLAREQQGVLLLPASVYNLRTNHFRIGFGRKDMPEALEALTKIL